VFSKEVLIGELLTLYSQVAGIAKVLEVTSDELF